MEKITSKILFLIRSKTFFKHFKFKFIDSKKAAPNSVFEENAKFKNLFNYHFDCSEPTTFNEYLCFLKHKYFNELWCKCADKLGAKEMLKLWGYEEFLPSTLGIYSNSCEIDLNTLPQKFVLKTNNDCGSVFLCDKSKTNFNEVFKKLDSSLSKDYSEKNNEWVYSKVKAKIFAEEFLEPLSGDDLIDYKIQTINGKFIFGYSVSNRKYDERYLLFDENFHKINCLYQSIAPNKIIVPKDFELMKKIALDISKKFLEVRIDFFETKNGIKIGELTFFTQSGHGIFSKKRFDYLFGKEFEKVKISG